MQDRLVRGLRRAGVRTLEEANRYLREEFVPEWNGRFARRPASDLDAHRPLRKDHKLESILSHVEERTVGNDYTLSWKGKRYQIPASQAKPRMRQAKVRIEERLDGSLVVLWHGVAIQLGECAPPALFAPESPLAHPAPPKRKTNWMEGFWIGDPAKRRRFLPQLQSPDGLLPLREKTIDQGELLTLLL
jgi:hypothetical protein